jgi:hypothetical protein
VRPDGKQDRAACAWEQRYWRERGERPRCKVRARVATALAESQLYAAYSTNVASSKQLHRLAKASRGIVSAT